LTELPDNCLEINRPEFHCEQLQLSSTHCQTFYVSQSSLNLKRKRLVFMPFYLQRDEVFLT